MRKKLLLTLTVIFCAISCSSDNNENSSSSIKPPSWIQGSWSINYGADDEDFITPLFKFKKDDFCVLGGAEICYAEYLEQLSQTSVNTSIEQSVTDNEYRLAITTLSVKSNYLFYRISDTEVKYINVDLGPDAVDLIKY